MKECYCDYVPATFYKQEVRRARKQHRCEECCGIISVDEQYENVSGMWDGYIDTFKTCVRCLDIRVWVKNNVPCLCWQHQSMIEDCEEAIKEACWRAPDETKGLWFGFLRRRILRDRFNEQRRAT